MRERERLFIEIGKVLGSPIYISATDEWLMVPPRLLDLNTCVVVGGPHTSTSHTIYTCLPSISG